RRRHTRSKRDWSSDVCSSDLFRPCWPSVTFSLLTLTAATLGAGSVLKWKLLLTPRPEVFFASWMLTLYEVLGVIFGRNWNSLARSEERRVGKERYGGCVRWWW